MEYVEAEAAFQSKPERNMDSHQNRAKPVDSARRRGFIGGSDTRIIMGSDTAALIHLWREKRGEAGPEDLSGNLIVQLGKATEDLNRTWYERNTGRTVGDVQRLVRHSAIPWMAATLDGIVTGIGFLGAGVIMRDGMNISGLTTAASIWAVAAIGILVGVGFYAAAIMLAITSGVDSRTLLAASREAADEVYYFVTLTGDMTTRSPAIAIPTNM